jgi:uncharacterized protein (TIGR03437 family)
MNNASYNLLVLTVAPGSIAAVFGTNLTDGTSCVPPACSPAFGSDGKLKTTMAGTEVTINGTPVPIFYATPSQLGIQIPTDLAGATAALQITNKRQTSTPQTVFLDTVSPGIFTFTQDGKGAGAITHLNALGTAVTSSNPARPGELVVVYATGLGAVSPPVATGALPSGESRAVAAVTVAIDGVPVVPDFAGLSGCCVGLNQINVRIPAGTRSADNIPVFLTVAGKQSNTVTVAVRP